MRQPALLAVAALALAASLPAVGQGTRLWTQTRLEEFEKGSAQAVALTSDGKLREGPAATELALTASSFVWTVAADKSGTAYAGTAAPASVLRIGADGKIFTLFETKDVSVQAVRLGPDGALYAATLPSGKVYKLDSAATAKIEEKNATVVFDLAAATKDEAAKVKPEATAARYIWALTFDATGRLYIATGGPAAVYRVDPAKPTAQSELFFKSDEQHIRSLAWDGKGNLIAGSDGSGLVYRIGPDGQGYVLFDAPRREITALAVAADGAIYAASVGDKSRNALPNLPVQPGSVNTMVQTPPSTGPLNQSATLPEGTELYVLRENQAPRKLWSSKEDIVYALAARADGVLALTGNRGRIFQIAADGSYADLARLEAQQALCLAEGPGETLLVGAGTTGKLYRLGGASAVHEFLSDVFDSGSFARFGRVETEPGARNVQILTRTGNVSQPARGWSAWQPLAEGRVATPAGRYLQWKAVLSANGELGAVGVNYLPVNAAPVVDDVVAVAGARYTAPGSSTSAPTVNISFGAPSPSAGASSEGSSSPLTASKDKGAVTVRWAAHDDNGDELVYALYLRGDGEKNWRLLKENLTEKAYSFDATTLPDGGYQTRVVASDTPAHTPAEALNGAKVSARFEIDTTAPVVGSLKAELEPGKCEAGAACKRSFKVSFVAEDGATPISRAEYSLDAGTWQFVEPVGGLSDAKRERYELRISLDAPNGKLAEHLITVRAFDRRENVGLAKTLVAGDEK